MRVVAGHLLICVPRIALHATRLRLVVHHLPYGITVFTCHVTELNYRHAGTLVIDLPTPEGWKAELT